MKNKIKEIQNRIEHDPKLKEAVVRMKPQKNFWGLAGIVLFFFIPELVVYLWQDELISWAHTHSLTEPLALQRWLFGELEEMFKAGVSWFNLMLGTLFLFWVLKP
jgi:hypothetical protein